MKRTLAALALAALAGCATTRPSAEPDLSGESYTPAGMAHAMAFQAVPPRYLSLMATGGFPSADQVLNCPTGHGNCALGWFANGYPDNTAVSYLAYQFGDTGTGLLSRFGRPLQQYSYHGLRIDIGEGGTVPADPTGGGSCTTALCENFTLTLHNTSSSIQLNAGTGATSIALTPGSGGVTISTPSTAGVGGITWMGALSNTVTTTSVPANSCVSVLLGTLTGAAVNSSCGMGDSNTSGATSASIQCTCYVSAANTVQIHACNVTTAAANISGTFKARVENY